jgi:hypothetical protein
MEGRCTECGNHNVALHHYQDYLCYNCYEKLFESTSKVEDDKPDFEIKHDTAIVKPSKDSLYGKISFTDDELSKFAFAGTIDFKMPNRMVFNPDCRVKDYDKLILFLFENMVIYDNAKGFDKIGYMFKEADK